MRRFRLGSFGVAVAAFALAAAAAAQTATDQQKQDENLPHAGGTEVTVTAPRIDVPLKENPAATTVVSGEQLENQPKSINAKEVLLLVPGVKVDDQADGERVHMSIRGQGILTERGVRGIKVLLDGLPLNDPSGFAPDLFDVDWATVKRVEVFRGPASALWGGGASGGIINIETRDGGPAPAAGEVSASAGSHGFWKTLVEAGGTDGNLNYRVSGSRMMLDGYRVHTAAAATNFYSKFNFDLKDGNHITAIVAGTSFFNENAEGLNITQVHQDPRQPNPDALTFNEFQRTRRATIGVTGKFGLSSVSSVDFALYARHTDWIESVPSSVDHRGYDTPGGFLQYRLDTPVGSFKNHLNLGADLDLQSVGDYQRPNLGRAREGDTILADQDIHQRGTGVYLLDQVELTPEWSVMAGVRTDSVDSTLTNKLESDANGPSGHKSFSKTAARVGVAWNPTTDFGAYTSWAQGFLPPAIEELAHNPKGFGGFNEDLIAATSQGVEAGIRGALAGMFTYDVAAFRLTTAHDFGRYRVQSRPLETFYNNAGSSTRYGLETLLGFYPTPQLSVELAYTFSHFRYDFVRFGYENSDNPDLSGATYYDTRLPNSPDHMATLDCEYRILPGLKVGLEAEMQSRAYIDPTQTIFIGGYTLYDARISYQTEIAGATTEFMLYGRNLGGKKYIAFTEPDPDGNSYQPGPEREVFGGVRVSF